MISNYTFAILTCSIPANAGIGYELTRQLLSLPSTDVLLGAPSVEKGEKAAKQLQNEQSQGSVEFLHLDVSSYESITVAAQRVSATHPYLTALVNNAAIASFPDSVPLHEQMDACFRTNATGVQMMGDAFGPLFEKSPTTARIVNVSSGAGSITRRLDPSSAVYRMAAPHYRASKAALSMITANQAVEFGEKGMKVFAYCPGFTVSSLSELNKAENGAKPTSEGAEPIVRILMGERDGEHAKFLHGTGQYEW